MNRRQALTLLGGCSTALVSAMAKVPNPLQTAKEAVRRGLPPLKITDVKVILTQMESSTHYVIVKVLTSEPGLYGLGCATHAERPLVVATQVEQYLKPMIIGRNADEIEDIWQTANLAPYWRGGIDANNALSGVDAALWDIMGKRAGMPVYAFFGGKVRTRIPVYPTLEGVELPAIEDQVRKKISEGYRYVKIGRTSNVGATQSQGLASGLDRPPIDPTRYVVETINMFDYLRSKVGFDIGLIHTVHERVNPGAALGFAKALEAYRPFFVEDLFAIEDIAWYETLRKESSTPVAATSMFVNQSQWIPLVANRWIDFLRIHVSAVGGLSMAHKAAQCCEFFNVRTAWHAPGMVSPVGHAVNAHLDWASYNFGIQEEHIFSEQVRQVFPGTPEIRDGLMISNDSPGLGIDIDERLAAKYPYTSPGFNRRFRLLDGSPLRP